jgi:hydrogenase maturation protease
MSDVTSRGAGHAAERRAGQALRAVVIGVGNEFRRDDGAGPRVLALLRERAGHGIALVPSDGEPVRLIEAWAGASLAIVVDAVRADNARPGRTHRIEVGHADAGPGLAVSSHGLGLGEAVGLARALDLMPGRLIVHAVEATEFGFGVGLTPAVDAATETLARAVLDDIDSAAG